ncbi:caspase family protein [Kribbella rubisoli]|uniref:caspase family protein n=1 Tax=Kribbella rubisoli TaxID=3075929 RepID=UPI0018E5A58D|nr:caspase family protein [Kribbella rubisoli]
MRNTKRERLRFSALPAHMIDEAVEDSSARQKILILDCCYAGAYTVERFAKSDAAIHTKAELGGRGRIVLTATDSSQYAFEGSEIHGEAAQSVFTRHVVEGLRSGAADLDADGDITADELYRYVYDAVVAEQPSQRPNSSRTLSAGSRTAGSDGKKLYVVGTDGANDMVQIVDLGNHQVVGSLADDLGAAVELAVSEDGQRIYISNFFQDGILVLDTVGPKVVGKIELKS